ncbi:hypothetical protein BH11CYA1_BH11CYA1_23630 [soil metagenome]
MPKLSALDQPRPLLIFSPFLKGQFATIGFVGSGHTLDLQRPLPYDAIHDLSGLADTALDGALAKVFAGYDIMLTAMDFAMAQKAQEAGLQVCVYDALAWYWKELPAVAETASLYICQNFFSVEERLSASAKPIAAPRVVSPLSDSSAPQMHELNEKVILLNLGGLSNPYWSTAGTLAYARLILEAFLPNGNAQGSGSNINVVVAANSAIAKALPEYGVKNLSREEMQAVLARASFALMTPGLGNIYDAARFDIPTIWLPPANDSQGQQLALLKDNDMVDAAVDWHDLLEIEAIDYSAEQVTVLQKLVELVDKSSDESASSAAIKEQLALLFQQHSQALEGCQHSRLVKLAERFGSGGAEQVAELVIDLAAKST